MKIPSNIKTFILTLALIIFNASYTSAQSDKDMVVAQMNYCINSLTNIINNKSIIVLDHETDQLINNLTMEHVSNLYEIADFRGSLLETVGNLQITEEERNILRRVNDMKEDGMLWQSLSNALDPTLLLFSGSSKSSKLQMGFMLLLTVARTSVEYKSAQNEQNIGELQSLWELRKKDMNDYIQLRKKALDLEYNLFHKYGLKEQVRLTEKNAIWFSDICKEPDANKRLRLLLDNRNSFDFLTDYYYHTGMAYVDLGNYAKAKPYLQEYISRYNRTPIFRYDEKSGCVALAMLAYDTGLNPSEKQELINVALKNLPNNGAALLQCVITILSDIKNPPQAYELLRLGIDNPNMDNKDAMVMFSANILDDIKQYQNIYKKLSDAVYSTRGLSLNSIIAYAIRDNNQNSFWNSYAHLLYVQEYFRHPWYGLWIWGAPILKSNFFFKVDNKYGFNINDIKVYREHYDGKKIVIKQNQQFYKDGLHIDDIMNDVDCFKANPNLMYLFLSPLIEGEVYKIKDNLDYGMIKSGEFRGLSEYTLTEDDLEDIVSYCKDKYVENDNTITLRSNVMENSQTLVDSLQLTCPIIENNTDTVLNHAYINGKMLCEFEGDSLEYQPYVLSADDLRDYIKVVLSGPSKTVLTYSLDSKDNTKAYLYSVENGGKISFQDPESVVSKVYAQLEEVEKEKLEASQPSFWQKTSLWFSTAFTSIGNWFASLWHSISSLWN